MRLGSTPWATRWFMAACARCSPRSTLKSFFLLVIPRLSQCPSIRTRYCGWARSQAAFASRILTSAGRIAAAAKSKWMSRSSGIGSGARPRSCPHKCVGSRLHRPRPDHRPRQGRPARPCLLGPPSVLRCRDCPRHQPLLRHLERRPLPSTRTGSTRTTRSAKKRAFSCAISSKGRRRQSAPRREGFAQGRAVSSRRKSRLRPLRRSS